MPVIAMVLYKSTDHDTVLSIRSGLEVRYRRPGHGNSPGLDRLHLGYL